MNDKLKAFAQLCARLVLASTFLWHGLRNFGLLGGGGLAAYRAHLEALGVVGADLVAIAITIGECLAGLFLLIGFMHKTMAWAGIVLLVGVIWFEQRHSFDVYHRGCGWSLALIALCLSVAAHGPGPWAYVLKRQKG